MSISGLELGQINSILYYGSGSFILFILSLYAITIYQIYNISNSQGNIPIYASLFKIFYFYVGLSVLVTVFFSILIVLNHSKSTNPAVGIYGFYNLSWENITSAISAIKASPAYTNSPVAQKETVLWLTVMIGAVKEFYVILIAATIFFIPLLGIYYPYQDCKRKYEAGDGATYCLFNALFSSILYGAMFYLLIMMMEREIQYLLSMAKDNGYADIPDASYSVLSDIKKNLNEVRQYANDMFNTFKNSIYK